MSDIDPDEVRRALEFFDKSEWDPEDEQREMQGNVDVCCAAAREWLRLREQHTPSPMHCDAPHNPACLRSFDARDWARDFRATAKSLGYCDMDEGWLIGWFANAIMRGFDEAERRREQPAPDVQAQIDAAYERGVADGLRKARS